MASAARFNNLPGIEFVTLDGQLVAIKDRPLTESVLIIGPAVDGPTDRVTLVNNASDVEQIYGPLKFDTVYTGPNNETTGYNGNALIKALREVSAGGAADIRLLRVGGRKATGTFDMPAALNAGVTGTITCTAKLPGRLYNTVVLTFTSGATSGSVAITQPTVKGGNITLLWSGAASGKTVAQLIDDINAHPRNKTVSVALGTITAITAEARLLNGTVTLANGSDGTIKDDLSTIKNSYYQALTHATTGLFSDFLADVEVDIVYLAGIYLDDVVVDSTYTTSVATDFAEFLARRTVDHPMIGVIGCRPLNDFSNRTAIANHHAALVTSQSGARGASTDQWMNAGYFLNNGFMYNDGTLEQPIDGGAYLQVCAGDVIFSDPDVGLYIESCAGVYAGTLARLKPQLPATYKPVNGIFALPYEFTRAQLDSMCGGVGRDTTQGIEGGGAYVTVRRIEGRGILFVRDVTASFRRSDFKDLQPLRIANAVHKGVKDIVFPFLGLQNDIPHRQAMTTQIKSFLDGMADAGALLGKDGIGYTLQVRADNPLSRLLGIIEIDITLRPALQIKQIKVRVRMSL
jgi:hypothetical protein